MANFSFRQDTESLKKKENTGIKRVTFEVGKGFPVPDCGPVDE